MAHPMSSIIIPLMIILPFLAGAVAFWLWMFRDMTNNDNVPGSSKEYWTLAFLFLNVFAAFYYYVTEYRKRY